MNEKGKEIISPERGKEEPSPEPEKPPENLKEVLEQQDKQVRGEVMGLKEKGGKLEEVLKSEGATENEIEEFKGKEKEIENKAKETEKEYKEQTDFGGESGTEEVNKEKQFVDYLEKKGYLGDKIKEDYLRIKDYYKQQLINQNKEPRQGELWDDLILREMDKNYAEYVKANVNDYDKNLINDYLNSGEKNLMPLKNRQEFLNIFFRNHYDIYANEKGEAVSMADYLKDYYKDIGVNIEVKFKTIDPDVKDHLAKKVLESEFLFQGVEKDEAFKKAFYAVESKDEKIKHILNDEVAIPHLIIEKDNVKHETPLIAGGRSVHIPLRSEEKDEFGKRKRKGYFIQIQVIHAPEFGGNIQKMLGAINHEIDHAINTPMKEQQKLDQELLSEGTADKSLIDFMNIQHRHLKDNPLVNNLDGFDYWGILEQVMGREAIGEKTSKGQEHRYAQGYIIADGYEKKEGKDKYKKLFYTGEANLTEELGDIVKIREEIDKKLKPQKEMFTQILKGELGEK